MTDDTAATDIKIRESFQPRHEALGFDSPVCFKLQWPDERAEPLGGS